MGSFTPYGRRGWGSAIIEASQPVWSRNFPETA
jgi:hypothetical protein